MDFLDEYDDSRPRFLFRGGGGGGSTSSSGEESPTHLSKAHIATCFLLSSLLLLLSYYTFDLSQTLFSLFLWSSLSLLLAPFAPSSVTGGDISVGRGPPLPDPDPIPTVADSVDSSNNNRHSRSRKQIGIPPVPAVNDQSISTRSENKVVEETRSGNVEKETEERDWTKDDIDLLKRQIAKHRVAGDPNRWEKIADAFKGKHGLESVIRTAKLIMEMKPRDSDPFEEFLKKRKPVDLKSEPTKGENETLDQNNKDLKKENWSSGDDLALLNALKAFPKDVSMRWDNIAAAVPRKSKSSCMKRFAELKRDFRNMKSSES